MKASLGVLLPCLLQVACLSAPTPASTARDGAVDGDASGGATDADPNAPDAAPVGGNLVCDGTDATPFGHALFLEQSSGDLAQISDSNQTGLDLTGSFTLEAWINMTVLPGDPETFTILSKDDFGGSITNRGYMWWIDRSGSTINVQARAALPGGDRGSEMVWPWAGAAQAVGEWHHFALILDLSQSDVQSSMLLLIDGQQITGLANDNAVDQSAVNDSGAPFVIGSWPQLGVPESYFVGAIDEVSVWNVARTPSEVRDSRFDVLVGSEPNLVGNWKFDENLEDATGNDNDLIGPSPDYCTGPSNP